MSYFKNIIKSTLLLGAIGVALAFAAPMLASFATSLGMAPALVTTLSMTHPIWGGLFFGAFGALNAIAAPVLDAVFGDTPTQPARAAAQERHPGAPAAGMAFNPTVSADRAEDAPSQSFQERFGQRAPQGSFEEKLLAARATTGQLQI